MGSGESEGEGDGEGEETALAATMMQNYHGVR
jgi:hypothetical protein